MYYSTMNSDLDSLLRSTTGSSANLSDAAAAGLLAFFGTYIVLIIAIAVLQIIAWWKIFTKAGEKGWKSIIPFYNIYVLYRISGMSPNLVFVYLLLLIPIVNIFAAVAIGIISLYQTLNLAKAFNKSTGFTVAMIVVPFIAELILGFGQSQYVGFGNTTTPPVENTNV